MRNRLLWFLLGAIGVALILLVANNDSGSTFGISNERFGHGVYLALWGLVIAAGVVGSRRLMGNAARDIAIWIAVVFVLIAGFQYRYELQDVAYRVAAGLIPGSPLSSVGGNGRSVFTLQKLDNGHFGVRADVNGAGVSMIVDTGATRTVLTADAASRAGIDVSKLDYNLPVMTANGPAQAASITIDELSVGTIKRRHMAVLVAAPGSLVESLLGMNFINSLAGFDVRGDRMVFYD
ncbi:MAG: TIGR02281 family clan AA aspartic protease [Rhizobiales bacterium]|nr:TIGR02281 family clan AA aspartic protease [Hyphomicrobiales bacterium]